MLSFLTHFRVNLEQHKLQPYMAQINYKALNETTWFNIAHTFMGNFRHNIDSKINTTPMKHMGHDTCLIVGYHNKVSLFNPNEQCFPTWKTLLIMFSNLCKKALTACFFRTLNFSIVKSSLMVYSIFEFTDQQTHRDETLESTITGALRELSGSLLQLRTLVSGPGLALCMSRGIPSLP